MTTRSNPTMGAFCVAAKTITVPPLDIAKAKETLNYSDRVLCFREFFLSVKKQTELTVFSVSVIDFITAVNRRQPFLPVNDVLLSLSPLYVALDEIEKNKKSTGQFFGFTSSYMYSYFRNFSNEGIIRYADRKITIDMPPKPVPTPPKPVLTPPKPVPTPPKPVLTPPKPVPTPPKPVPAPPKPAEVAQSLPPRKKRSTTAQQKLAVAPPTEVPAEPQPASSSLDPFVLTPAETLLSETDNMVSTIVFPVAANSSQEVLKNKLSFVLSTLFKLHTILLADPSETSPVSRSPFSRLRISIDEPGKENNLIIYAPAAEQTEAYIEVVNKMLGQQPSLTERRFSISIFSYPTK